MVIKEEENEDKLYDHSIMEPIIRGFDVMGVPYTTDATNGTSGLLKNVRR